MIAEILLTTGLGLILYAFYKWATQNNDFFIKRGIKQMTPTFLFGNSGAFFSGKCDATEFAMNIYNACPNEKYILNTRMHLQMSSYRF